MNTETKLLKAIEDNTRDKQARLDYAEYLDKLGRDDLAFAYRWAVSKDVFLPNSLAWRCGEYSHEDQIVHFVFDYLWKGGRRIVDGIDVAWYYTVFEAYEDLSKALYAVRKQAEIG